MIDTDNIVWKNVCLVHTAVVLAGTIYLSVIVIQLMVQQMKNPLRYEEGRCVMCLISSITSVFVYLGIGLHLTLLQINRETDITFRVQTQK